MKASPAGKWLGVETDRAGRVKVNPDLTISEHPETFVVGDTALTMNKEGKPLPGLCPGGDAGRDIRGSCGRNAGGGWPNTPPV